MFKLSIQMESTLVKERGRPIPMSPRQQQQQKKLYKEPHTVVESKQQAELILSMATAAHCYTCWPSFKRSFYLALPPSIPQSP